MLFRSQPMLNSYQVEKKFKERSKVTRKIDLEHTWNNWRVKRSPKWVNNYRKRVEKFVVDVNV